MTPNEQEHVDRIRAERAAVRAEAAASEAAFVRRMKLWGAIGAALIGLGIAAGMVGCPHYNVWQQGLRGRAELNRADANRRIKVFEAEAKLQSSKLDAQAEVERAKGVAEANRIVADGLKGHKEYLQYLWIDKVAAGASREIVYVPTEAGVPILEAGRVVRPPPSPTQEGAVP